MSPFTSESGQGMVEYALAIILVAVVVIAGLFLYGEFVRDLYVEIVSNI